MFLGPWKSSNDAVLNKKKVNVTISTGLNVNSSFQALHRQMKKFCAAVYARKRHICSYSVFLL